LQDGSSLVTWVEHVDVHEKDLRKIFQPFVESGFAFGAKRWISTLQRQVEHFLFSMGINTPLSDTPITPEGRRSLVAMANKMVVSFCNDISNSTYHHWTKSQRTRDRPMEVRTNKRRGDPDKPPGLNRTAGCTIQHLSQHTKVFDFLRDMQTRPLWDSMSMDSSIHVLAHVTTGIDPRNCISVFAISSYNDFLILQECCTDATGSYVIYAPIDQTIFHTMLSGTDPNPFPMMASGFSILPNVSEDTLGGTLLTMVFQISVKAISSNQAVDMATAVIQGTLKKIKVAVP
jgi:homeobox-leucine zipper protein